MLFLQRVCFQDFSIEENMKKQRDRRYLEGKVQTTALCRIFEIFCKKELSQLL